MLIPLTIWISPRRGRLDNPGTLQFGFQPCRKRLGIWKWINRVLGTDCKPSIRSLSTRRPGHNIRRFPACQPPCNPGGLSRCHQSKETQPPIWHDAIPTVQDVTANQTRQSNQPKSSRASIVYKPDDDSVSRQRSLFLNHHTPSSSLCFECRCLSAASTPSKFTGHSVVPVIFSPPPSRVKARGSCPGLCLMPGVTPVRYRRTVQIILDSDPISACETTVPPKLCTAVF